MTTSFRTFSGRPFKLMAATVVLAAAGGLTLAADGAPPGGPMHHQMHGPMSMMGGHHVGRMLDAVNATPEQRAQIKSIMDAAHADLKSQRESGRALRDQGLQIFTQPNVDARAAESLRQQMLAQHDAASKRMLQAMLDVSRVLTPDQRKQLGDLMAQQRAKMEARRAERAAQKPGQ
jgi:protein CpxP